MFKISRYIIHLLSTAYSYSFYHSHILPSYGNAKMWMRDVGKIAQYGPGIRYQCHATESERFDGASISTENMHSIVILCLPCCLCVALLMNMQHRNKKEERVFDAFLLAQGIHACLVSLGVRPSHQPIFVCELLNESELLITCLSKLCQCALSGS